MYNKMCGAKENKVIVKKKSGEGTTVSKPW